MGLNCGSTPAASKQSAQGAKLPATKDGKVLVSGGRVRQQAAPEAAASRGQPATVKVGDATVVRFDGLDDHLRITDQKGDDLKAFTVFIVGGPRANPGEFRGLLALNAPNGRDYETGLTIDLGPGGTPRFTQLNVEGKGFGGWRKPREAWRRISASSANWKCAARRNASGWSWTAKITTNARGTTRTLSLSENHTRAHAFYTNGPSCRKSRAARCDIAEVLLFNRTLSDDETKKVRAYLDAKHAALKQNASAGSPRHRAKHSYW